MATLLISRGAEQTVNQGHNHKEPGDREARRRQRWHKSQGHKVRNPAEDPVSMDAKPSETIEPHSGKSTVLIDPALSLTPTKKTKTKRVSRGVAAAHGDEHKLRNRPGTSENLSRQRVRSVPDDKFLPIARRKSKEGPIVSSPNKPM